MVSVYYIFILLVVFWSGFVEPRGETSTSMDYDDDTCINEQNLLANFNSTMDSVITTCKKTLAEAKDELKELRNENIKLGKEMYEIKKLLKDQCMYPFFNLNGQCVAVIRTEGSWETQQKECKKLGNNVDLLEVTEESLPLLKRYMKEFAEIYSISKSVWIGGQRNDEGNFKWSSGQNVSLSWGWYSGEPNNYSGDEVCMLMYINEGEFNDEYCSYSIGALCEKII